MPMMATNLSWSPVLPISASVSEGCLHSLSERFDSPQVASRDSIGSPACCSTPSDSDRQSGSDSRGLDSCDLGKVKGMHKQWKRCTSGTPAQHRSPISAPIPFCSLKLKKKNGDHSGKPSRASSGDLPKLRRKRPLGQSYDGTRWHRSSTARDASPEIEVVDWSGIFPSANSQGSLSGAPKQSDGNIVLQDSDKNSDDEKNRTVVRRGMLHHPYSAQEVPYLLAYSPAMLDNDFWTYKLLRRLNPYKSPSWHDYGKKSPSNVLDLGCGEGHWVLYAAEAWKSAGTRVTGLDILDLHNSPTGHVSRKPTTAEYVPKNTTWKRGNFVKCRLPFPDKTFDLVRMANLNLCIPSDRWDFVIEEVKRVLVPGGRLELIDDALIYPVVSLPPSPQLSASSTDDIVSDASSAAYLEDIFADMIVERGLSVYPQDIIAEALGRVFGIENSRQLQHLRLAVPPRELLDGDTDAASHRPYQPPGLVLLPTSKLLRFSPLETEMYACKNMHVLLGSKNALMDYLVDTCGNLSLTEDDINDILWKYECFKRPRFNWPMDHSGLCMDEENLDASPLTSLFRINAGSLERERSFSNPSWTHLQLDQESVDKLTEVRAIRVYSAVKVDY
ncbi:uncharacterized protein LAESUDRAFT_757293 [Laetiporus sulphureus 93-53]|uniref:Methyltransferase domain-containing protein n=1 Tax=Laetiporus sulphureus 93-53 TaxID=1314785 RepID=A0A165F7X8_9APHY|nr:uncharacterized protein LAESUDRAFT_757293 [Laetiporus sulphureus 93-53]KZT08563.1 hypothetical protein LAESUDRAFT_757293 [Laetiporus sulphureus 93-53]